MAFAATDNPQFTQRKPKMSPAEWVKMLRERMADVQVAVQLAKLGKPPPFPTNPSSTRAWCELAAGVTSKRT